MSAVAEFSAFVRTHAVAAGYDLSGPRSGGRLALANDTGMSHASVCRMLNGKTIPAAETFESIAHAIDVPVGYLFELARIVSPGALTGTQPAAPQPLTVQQAAARLGIHSPLHVTVFEAITAALLTEGGAA